jgi:hypothetical protein
MSSSLYLLVSEGPTDILVIDKIAKKIAKDQNKQIEIRELSPQKDATTNRYPSHGWEEVRRWCRLYGNTTNMQPNSFEAIAAKRKSWKQQIAIANADGLIIQIDTDIVEYIEDLTPKFSGSTKRSRKNFAQKALLHWLGEATTPNKIYFLLSTSSTETWILAAHDRAEEVFNDLPSGFDFEDIQDVIERLFKLGYASYIDPETQKQKLKKDLNTYKHHAIKIVDNLTRVRSECEEVKKLVSILT